MEMKKESKQNKKKNNQKKTNSNAKLEHVKTSGKIPTQRKKERAYYLTSVFPSILSGDCFSTVQQFRTIGVNETLRSAHTDTQFTHINALMLSHIL